MLRPHRAYSRGSSLARQGFEGAQDAIRTGIHVDRRDVAPADDPVTVDDEQRSLAEPVAVAVHAVTPRHRPFGLEVREQGEMQFALAGERSVAPGAIHRDAEQLGAVALELGQDLVVQRHLIAADRTPVRGIERQNHGLAAVVPQRDGLIRGALECELGCPTPGRKRTRCNGIRVGHGMLLSQRFRFSDSSGTIGRSSRSALRSTAIVVRAPIRSVTSKRWRSSIPDTVCPSKPMMMSPDVTPARAAGLSGSTPVTSTPLFASIPSARCASRSNGTFCPATPIRPRRISWPVTTFAVLIPTAKQIPWAGRITAVLTPTTRPRESTSGPPELPGFNAASVWITSSINRPPTERNEPPNRPTTPAGTVLWKPSGLPIAITSCPTRSAAESPNSATVSETGGTRMTARSVSGASPTSSDATGRPSANATSMRVASCTTWLLVSTNPSGVNTNPEPLPGTSRAGRPRRSTLCR